MLYIVRYPMTDLQEGLLLLAGVCVQAIDIKTVRIPRAAADTEWTCTFARWGLREACDKKLRPMMRRDWPSA